MLRMKGIKEFTRHWQRFERVKIRKQVREAPKK